MPVQCFYIVWLRRHKCTAAYISVGLILSVLRMHIYVCNNISLVSHAQQGLSQDLETGCLKLAVVKLLGIQIF